MVPEPSSLQTKWLTRALDVAKYEAEGFPVNSQPLPVKVGQAVTWVLSLPFAALPVL